jgi:hypothetical protein
MTLNVSQLNQIGGLLAEVNPDGSTNNAATQQLLGQVLQQLGGNFTQTTVSDHLHTSFVAEGGFGVAQLISMVAAVVLTAFGMPILAAMLESAINQLASGQGFSLGQVLEAGAVALATEGLDSGLGLNDVSLSQVGSDMAKGVASTAEVLKGVEEVVGQSLVSATVNTVAYGGSFGRSLETGAFTNLAAMGAGAIGGLDEKGVFGTGLTRTFLDSAAHGVLGCVAGAAEGTGCAGGAIGGAASAALTPFVANAVTGGDPNVTPGQAAAIAGIATLTGGVFAGLAGQNPMAGANAAQNEALNNCLGHPESCLQMAKNALNSASATASNVWTGITNPQPTPNSGFTSAFDSAMDAGTAVPGMESATNLDLFKGMGNVALNAPSGSFPGMSDYQTIFQYNNPLIGSIGETYGLGGISELGAGWLSRGNATSSAAGVFDTGVNITPMSSANKYRFIGANGTFVTPMSSIESVIGPISPTATEVTISQTQATALENSLGLNPGSLESSNVLSIVNGVGSRAPRSPLSGNNFFLGGGQGLPGGGAELVIDSIPSAGGPSIRQITVKVK